MFAIAIGLIGAIFSNFGGFLVFFSRLRITVMDNNVISKSRISLHWRWLVCDWRVNISSYFRCRSQRITVSSESKTTNMITDIRKYEDFFPN